MQINKLSTMTQINIETIRKYRKMGFLHPQKLNNGYYDYSIADFSSLVYLRKMREYGMPLKDIYEYEHFQEADDLIQMLDEEEQTVAQQIETLKERQRFIRFEKRHVQESVAEGMGNVQVMQSIDEKIDYYGEEVIQRALQQLDARTIYLTTTSCIRISKEILNGDSIDKTIHVEAGFGLYRFMIDRRHIEMPPDAYIVPNGICISQMISLRENQEINIQDLEPMITYAKEIQRPFISDTTAYLARIRHDHQGIIFDYRIRACIEQNDIKDADVD